MFIDFCLLWDVQYICNLRSLYTEKSHKMNEKGTLILPLLINHVNQLEIYSEEKRYKK